MVAGVNGRIVLARYRCGTITHNSSCIRLLIRLCIPLYGRNCRI